VYRILQEALNNVARHSKSTEARVAFERNAARLRLEVEDHGVGFKPGPAAGIGLIAMRERAEILGGAVAFSRPSQGGTLVTLDVPVANAEARE